MKNTLFSLAAAAVLGCAAAFPAAAIAETHNLVPNWDFSDRLNPLNGWRIDFPYSEVYRANASYMKISDSVRDGDTPALVADLPPGIADNQGARVESGFIKIVPGASYHSSVDVMTYDLAAKIYVEVYALDPSEPGPPSIDRVPAMNGMPALVKCYRAVFPNPPDQSKAWFTDKSDFTVPTQAIILGKPAPPVYATVKAVILSNWVGGKGKIYLSKFVLTKTKDPTH